jgi:hypothetical protein
MIRYSFRGTKEERIPPTSGVYFGGFCKNWGYMWGGYSFLENEWRRGLDQDMICAKGKKNHNSRGMKLWSENHEEGELKSLFWEFSRNEYMRREQSEDKSGVRRT